MFFNTILLLVTGAAAWTVPVGQLNGVYSVYTNGAGVSEHTLIKLITETNITTKLTTRSAKFYPKRQNPGENDITCEDYALSGSDNGNAASELEAQCGNGAFVGEGKDFYSIVGGSVVYFCNYAGGSNQCFASEAVDAFSRITSQCGLNTAGYDTVPDRDDEYGYQHTGAGFCHGRGA